MKILSLNIARNTCNYEAMCSFYEETLQMKPVVSWDEPGNRGTLFSPAKSVGTTVIEIIDLENVAKPGIRPENISLSIEVEDVDGWHDELVAAGVEIARKLEDAPWEHRSFGIDDPDGFRIWFYQDMNT